MPSWELDTFASLGNDKGRGIAVLFLPFRKSLWNGRPQQQKCECGDGPQRQERDAIAEVLNQLSAEHSAESCAEPNCCCKTALDEIEPARGAGSVRHDED